MDSRSTENQPDRPPDRPSADGGTNRQSRAQILVDAALERILNDPTLVPGSRLPTERALSDELGVPRSAVRSALLRLEAQKRVVRMIGSGTYLADPAVPVARRDGDASPAEIMETRLVIEPRLAVPVVAHANSADLERIRQAVDRARASTDFAQFEHWDGEFHQSIADATHNRLLISLYRAVTEARDQTEWGELKRSSITEERRQQYNLEHEAIIVALQSRNAQAAERALHRHLVSVRENLLGV